MCFNEQCSWEPENISFAAAQSPARGKKRPSLCSTRLFLCARLMTHSTPFPPLFTLPRLSSGTSSFDLVSSRLFICWMSSKLSWVCDWASSLVGTFLLKIVSSQYCPSPSPRWPFSKRFSYETFYVFLVFVSCSLHLIILFQAIVPACINHTVFHYVMYIPNCSLSLSFWVFMCSPEHLYRGLTWWICKQHKSPTYMHFFIFTPMHFCLKEHHLQGVFIVE